MVHEISSLEELISSSTNVVNVDAKVTAKNVLDKLNQAYTILGVNENWKGKDAGAQINNIVEVYNAMAKYHYNLADLGTYVFNDIAVKYREIQSQNGASVEVPAKFATPEQVAAISYQPDQRDVVEIKDDEANNAVADLDEAVKGLEELISAFKNDFSVITTNWKSGPKREEFMSEFQDFESNIKGFEEKLNEAKEHVSRAVANYQGIDHKVTNIDQLLADADDLLKNICNGSSNSASSVIELLGKAYNDLVSGWRGSDADVNIPKVAEVHNAMVDFRSVMVQLAKFSYNNVGIAYRQLQKDNGGAAEVPAPIDDTTEIAALNEEIKTGDETFMDTGLGADARTQLQSALTGFEGFLSSFTKNKDAILTNWSEGTNHKNFQDYFEETEATIKGYEATINEVIAEIDKNTNRYEQ